MDTVGRELCDRHLPNLAALAGLDAPDDRIREELGLVLDALPRTSAGTVPRSALTSSGYPVELGLMIAGGQVAGLKYTVDLLVSGAPVSLTDVVWSAIAPAMDRLGNVAGRTALERSVRRLVDESLGGIDAVYWSVAYARDTPPRVRIHLIGRGDGLSRTVLQGLVPHVADQAALDAVLAAASSLGRSSVDYVGLGVDRNGVVGCKLYLLTNPFVDLRTITRLAAALDLSTGRALSLVRWYRHFIGHHWGQVGAFGVGVDVTPRSVAVEAYAFPSSENRAALRQRIDAYARRTRGGMETMGRIWSVLEGESLYLAGSGMETTSFLRLGRMTIYIGVTH